jgi:hypothetical protein
MYCFTLLTFSVTAQTGNGNSSDRMFFRAKLYAANGNIADGNMVAFDDDFTNGYDGYDAIKMMNPGENFGLRRDGRILAVEARYTLCPADTLYYDIRNLAQQTYQVKFAPQYMSAVTLIAILKDNFTGTQTIISLSDSTFFYFTITSNPASKVADRFMIVFMDPNASGAALPVKFTSVEAKPLPGENTSVRWTVAEELNVKEYLVERSDNGINFTNIAGVAAYGFNSGIASYEFTDRQANQGTVFYRITGVDIDGRLNRSKTVKIADKESVYSVRLLGNPAAANNINLEINGVTPGNYSIMLTSTLGQQLYNNKISITAGRQLLRLNAGQIPDGIYLLTLRTQNGIDFKQSVLIKN